MRLLKSITDSDFFGGEPEFMKEVSRFASRGVLFNDLGQVAMLEMTAHNLYKLPGGGIEEGESSTDAFLREIKEETGCIAEVIYDLGFIEEHKIRNHYLQHSSCFIAKLTEANTGTSLTDDEKELGMRVVWLDLSEALAIMRLAEQRCEEYSARFMLRRDLTILEEAAAWLLSHGMVSTEVR